MRLAQAALFGLLTMLCANAVLAQAEGWVAVAADTAGTGIATAIAPSKAEAGRRAKVACGRPTCEVVTDRQGGCAGALRIVLMGPVQKWTGERTSEWQSYFQRTCPSGQCVKSVACVPAAG
jgi:hypothetical protein